MTKHYVELCEQCWTSAKPYTRPSHSKKKPSKCEWSRDRIRMSKIFEALQRSVSERTGFPLSEAPDIATELLHETERLHRSVAATAELPLPTEPSTAPNLLGEMEKPAGLRSCSTLVPSLTP